MSKKKTEAKRAEPLHDMYDGHRLKLLVEVDDQWYEVPNAIFRRNAFVAEMQVIPSAVDRTIRDLGPIPAPKRWRADA